ncbi:MAG: hypothetical protein ACI9VM_000948 [Candidatus Azotimanducaceae bacterium]|jgi:hypothetical protein
MKYILDFDRVLFDTDRFFLCLEEHGLDEIPRGRLLLQKIAGAGINWMDFVNKDALSFLEENGTDCAVVSSYVSRNRGDNEKTDSELAFFQTEKIRLSGITERVSEVKITGNEKHEALTYFAEKYGTDMVFLDDDIEHVATAHELGYRAMWLPPKEVSRASSSAESAPIQKEFETVGTFSDFVQCMRNEAAAA